MLNTISHDYRSLDGENGDAYEILMADPRGSFVILIAGLLLNNILIQNPRKKNFFRINLFLFQDN